MKLTEFKTIVAEHPDAYAGVAPETDATIGDAEAQLGCRLPAPMIWLLCHHGYSEACGVSSLQDCVADTLRCRNSISLPNGFIILNDLGDAGVVLMDVAKLNVDGDCPVIWTYAGAVHVLSETGRIPDDASRFEGFAEWSQSRLEEVEED